MLTYLHTDHLATPRYGSNAGGSRVWTWDSGAFGKEAATGTATVNLRFPGQYRDAETGLHYNWNRYYNPAIGRYVSSDPIGLAGGLNTFGYAGQSPVVFIDPEGLWYINPEFGSPESRGAIADFAGDILWDETLAKCLFEHDRTACIFSGIELACGVKIAKTAGRVFDKAYDAYKRSKAKKLPVPSVPDGMTPSEFGKDVVGWGSRADGAKSLADRLDEDLVEDMKNRGLTKEMAEAWRKFYENEYMRNPNNSAAKERAELMKKIVEYF